MAAWLVCAACVDNPYVIGAIPVDAAAPEDATLADTAAEDARTPDTSVPDAAADATSSDATSFDACESHGDALVCSGFEDPSLTDWSAPIVMGSAQVEGTTARARSGEGSLRASSSGADSEAVVARDFAPQLSGTLHLRVWMYVPGDVATRTINVFFLGDEPNASVDPAAAFLGTDLNLEEGALQVYSPQSFPDRVTGTLAIPRDRWFCLRAEMEIATEGAMRVYVDDVLAVEAAPHDTLPDAGVHLLRAGVDWSSGQSEPFEVFMDDLVLAQQRVDCADP